MFNDVHWPDYSKIQHIIQVHMAIADAWARLKSLCGPMPTVDRSSVRWKLPPYNGIKVNIDGAVTSDGRHAAVGCVGRTAEVAG